MVALSQLVLLITTKVVGGSGLNGLSAGLLGVGGAAGIAAGAIAALTVAAIAFGAISFQKYLEFSIQMGLVSSATQATAEEFKMLEDEALNLGRTLGTFNATEAANAMKLLAFSGFEVNEILAATETIMKFAIATQIDLAMATDITARALRTFGIEAQDVSRVTDVLTAAFTGSATTVEELGTAFSYVGPIAASAGHSLEETAAAIMVLANVGIRGSMAGTQLRQVLMRLQAPTSSAAKTLSKLGVELYELGPAAQSTQRALNSSVRELSDLEDQMKKTSDATRELDMGLKRLNIDEAKNNLEIMKIRDKAADENRGLTESELMRINQLKRANDDLNISQLELSIQRDELSLVTENQKIKEEELNVTIEEQNELFNNQKGSMKDLVTVVKEFNDAMVDLSDAQKAEALNTIFGLRAISGFQTLMANTDQLETFTDAMNDAEGATEAQAAVVEDTAGVAWKEFTSAIQTFMIEVGKEIAPVIVGMTDALVGLKPLLDAIIIVVGGLVVGLALLTPAFDALVWVVTEFSDEIAAMAKELAVVFAILGIIVTLTTPLFYLIVGITSFILALGLLIRVLMIVGDYIRNVFRPVIEKLQSTFAVLKDKMMELYTDIMGRLGPAISFIKDLFIELGNGIYVLLEPFIDGLMLAINILVVSLDNLFSSLKILGSEIYDDIAPGLIMLGNLVMYLGEKLYTFLAPAFQMIGRFIMENTDVVLILLAIALWPLIVAISAIVVVIVVLIAALIGIIAVIAAVVNIITYLVDKIIWLNQKGDELKDNIVDWITSFSGFGDVIGTVADTIDRLVTSMTSAKDTAGELIDDLSSGDVGGVVSTLTGMIPGAAKGNIFSTPSLIQVAEERPEVVMPVEELGSTTGGGNSVVTNDTYNINIYPAEGTNGEQLVEEFIRALENERTNKRGSVFNV